jgi:hypothetical protein
MRCASPCLVSAAIFGFFFSLLENVADTEVSYRGNEKIPSSRSEQFEVTNEL